MKKRRKEMSEIKEQIKRLEISTVGTQAHKQEYSIVLSKNKEGLRIKAEASCIALMYAAGYLLGVALKDYPPRHFIDSAIVSGAVDGIVGLRKDSENLSLDEQDKILDEAITLFEEYLGRELATIYSDDSENTSDNSPDSEIDLLRRENENLRFALNSMGASV